MHLLRTPDLNLTVFPNDTPVFHTKEQMIQAATLGAASFVRSVAIDIPRELSLQSALNLADEQMLVINELTDTTTVDHEWGLVRSTPTNTRNQRFTRSAEHVVPKNHMLAARVEVIQGTPIDPWSFIEDTSLDTQFREALRNYEVAYRGRYYMKDVRVSQFVVPDTPHSTGQRVRPVLVDIEPLLAKRSLKTRVVGRTAFPPAKTHIYM